MACRIEWLQMKCKKLHDAQNVRESGELFIHHLMYCLGHQLLLKRAGCEHPNPSQIEVRAQLQHQKKNGSHLAVILTFLKSCTSSTSSLPFPILKISMRWPGSISSIPSVSSPSSTALYGWSYTCNDTNNRLPLLLMQHATFLYLLLAMLLFWLQRILKCLETKHLDQFMNFLNFNI